MESWDRAEAEQIINKAEGRRRRTKYIVNYGIAQSYALLGEKDAAFVELEKAYQAHDSYLPRMKVDPVMDPLPG